MKSNTHLPVFLMIFFLQTLSLSAQIWTPINGLPSNAALKAVHFTSVSYGWVAGENGTIMKTTDGGSTWNISNSGTSQTLRAIFFVDSTYGWACGDQGTLIATSDSGATWVPQNSGTTNTLTGVEFVNVTTGWVVGINSTLLKTTTSGSTWTAQAIQGGNMWGLSMINATNGWSAGDYNSVQGSVRLLKTTNGNNWTTFYNSGITTFNSFNDIHFSDNNTGWVVGTNGVIRKTTDSGATTWTAQTSGTNYELLSVDFIDNLNGYACGRQGIILHTSDGGTNWVGQYSGYSSGTLWEIDMINATIGFAVGDFGILKYTVSSPTQPLVLYQPNGAEIFQTGTKRFILWQAQSSITNVKIDYSVDGGSNWLPVINSTPAATGSYAWNVPNNPSVNCKVRISNTANILTNSMSVAPFYIMNSPQGIDYSVLTTAAVSTSPLQIIVSWQNDSNALSYSIDRKLASETTWTNLASLSGTTLNYTDTNVSPGVIYDYRVTKTTPLLTGYGYVYSGIEIPAPDSRGTLLVAINNTFTPNLTAELQQLTSDLVGDGWKVVIQDFPENAADVSVKNWVTSQYNLPGANVRALFIIGHMAIPYAGNYAPDGHAERIGAQPADVFYADIDGNWTDTTVTTMNTGTIYTPNVPGDGKWDQSAIPSSAELQVGRIDMYNMTAAPLIEIDLIKQYLNKNHAFRHKINNPARKALLNPHLDSSLPATSAVGWRSFSPMVGFGNIDVVNTNGCGANCNAFIDALENNSYLWTYMAGGGTDTSCAGSVFTSDYCFTRTLNTVFMQLYGSYFVEWAKGGLPVPNNLLRAPLTNSGLPLATCWTGGSPRWYFHPMGMGETIGFTTKLSQNNTTVYDPGNNQNLGGIHMALMGDPSLRLHMVYPVSNLTISAVQNSLQLNWSASNDSNIAGYNIYRSNSISGDFIRLNTNPVTVQTFTDSSPSLTTTNLYMVRAIKLETTPSGSYYNMSTGVFISSDALSTPDNTPKHALYLYPNPVSKELYFSEPLHNIEVYSVYGQLIVYRMSSATHLNVESFQEGVYYIKTETNFIKFIVKH